MNLCWRGGCYCKPGFLWDKTIKECVDEKQCSNDNDDYIEKKPADSAADENAENENPEQYDDEECEHNEILKQLKTNITQT